jgi:sugar phosphate isomerase/epimerase
MAYRPLMRTDQIALQLYTVRELASNDLPGTLRAVAATGYESVEIAALDDTPASELGRLLDETGLRPIAEHVGIEQLRSDPVRVGDRMEVLHCPRVIVPWLPEDNRRTPDDVRGFASELNGIGRQLAERGIRLGYHNHAFEFEPLDGTTVWDVLLAEVSPEIELELDVFWASVGGRDPVETIRSAGTRLRLLHMKDRGAGAEPRDVPVGEGTLDIPGIVRAGREAGVEWYVAEQDEPRDPLANVATSYRYLASLGDA